MDNKIYIKYRREKQSERERKTARYMYINLQIRLKEHGKKEFKRDKQRRDIDNLIIAGNII